MNHEKISNIDNLDAYLEKLIQDDVSSKQKLPDLTQEDQKLLELACGLNNHSPRLDFKNNLEERIQQQLEYTSVGTAPPKSNLSIMEKFMNLFKGKYAWLKIATVMLLIVAIGAFNFLNLFQTQGVSAKEILDNMADKRQQEELSLEDTIIYQKQIITRCDYEVGTSCQEQKSTIELWKYQDNFRSETRSLDGQLITTSMYYDGWYYIYINGAQKAMKFEISKADLGKDDLTKAISSLPLQQASQQLQEKEEILKQLQEKYGQVEVLGQEEWQGQSVYMLSLVEENKETTIWIDQNDYRELRYEEQLNFSNYISQLTIETPVFEYLDLSHLDGSFDFEYADQVVDLVDLLEQQPAVTYLPPDWESLKEISDLTIMTPQYLPASLELANVYFYDESIVRNHIPEDLKAFMPELNQVQGAKELDSLELFYSSNPQFLPQFSHPQSMIEALGFFPNFTSEVQSLSIYMVDGPLDNIYTPYVTSDMQIDKVTSQIEVNGWDIRHHHFVLDQAQNRDVFEWELEGVNLQLVGTNIATADLIKVIESLRLLISEDAEVLSQWKEVELSPPSNKPYYLPGQEPDDYFTSTIEPIKASSWQSIEEFLQIIKNGVDWTMSPTQDNFSWSYLEEGFGVKEVNLTGRGLVSETISIEKINVIYDAFETLSLRQDMMNHQESSRQFIYGFHNQEVVCLTKTVLDQTGGQGVITILCADNPNEILISNNDLEEQIVGYLQQAGITNCPSEYSDWLAFNCLAQSVSVEMLENFEQVLQVSGFEKGFNDYIEDGRYDLMTEYVGQKEGQSCTLYQSMANSHNQVDIEIMCIE